MSNKKIEKCIWSLYQRNWPLDLATRECHATFPSMSSINGTAVGSVSPVSSVGPDSPTSLSVGPTLVSPTSAGPLTNSTSIVIGEIDDCIWTLYQRNWPIDLVERECTLNFLTKSINGTMTSLPDSTVSLDIGPTAALASDEAAIPNVWIW